MLTPEQKVLRAKLAAHCLHAMGGTNTAAGTKALLDRFEREVDPDRTLDPGERAKRAEHAKRAYFVSLALKSSKKRSAGAARKRRSERVSGQPEDGPNAEPHKSATRS